ncbi:hypothetical protein JW865_01555 [Candidatus Bathyarchaeota archaeon]|nr:hypothetical protein [Candidatus Bathyarchaeota archaeon]
MARCEVCGKSKLFLETYRCIICETEACEDCLMPLLKVFGDMKQTLLTRKRWPYKGEIVSVCSEKCYNTFKNIVIEEINSLPPFQPTNQKIANIIEESKKLKPLFNKIWETYEVSFIGSSHEVFYHPDNMVSIPKYGIPPQHLDDDKISKEYNRSKKLENIDKKGTSIRLLLELIKYCETRYANNQP